jgi:hypothetical protein
MKQERPLRNKSALNHALGCRGALAMLVDFDRTAVTLKLGSYGIMGGGMVHKYTMLKELSIKIHIMVIQTSFRLSK